MLDAKRCVDYDNFVKDYQLYLYPILVSKLVDLLEHNPQKILDLGCGPGYLSFSLGAIFQNSEIYSLDINQEMLNIAKQNYPLYSESMDINLSFIQGDVHNLAFTDNTFDLVVSYSCLHHWKDIHNAIREIIRVLNKDGLAVIIDTNPPEDFMYSEMVSFLNNESYSYFIDKAWRESLSKEILSDIMNDIQDSSIVYSIGDYEIEVENLIFSEEYFSDKWNKFSEKTISACPKSWIIKINKVKF
ncbi:class I SAM-dependent methyltransferase [Streptococcus sp.]